MNPHQSLDMSLFPNPVPVSKTAVNESNEKSKDETIRELQEQLSDMQDRIAAEQLRSKILEKSIVIDEHNAALHQLVLDGQAECRRRQAAADPIYRESSIFDLFS